MQNVKYVPMGFQELSSANLSGAVSPTPPAGATIAVLSAETGGVRWRDDGTDPTTTTGILLGRPFDDKVYQRWRGSQP